MNYTLPNSGNYPPGMTDADYRHVNGEEEEFDEGADPRDDAHDGKDYDKRRK